MLAIVAPGQGAQKPGFLTPWLEASPRFAARLNWLGAVADLDLVHYGTEADEDTIRDTAIAQPLLVASSLVTLLELFPVPSVGFSKVSVAAGHSVGEIAAAVGAGTLRAEQAMVFVRERGRAMAKASAARPTSMTAIIGGKPEEVLEAIESCGLTAANNNGSGQIVAAGTVEQLEQLASVAPRRTRLIPLSVAGAFHTEHMRPAVAHLKQLAVGISTRDPRMKLLSNRDGQVVPYGPDVLSRMVDQVANPVRWDLCMKTMAELGVTGILELPPAGTLTGIAKRNLPSVELFSLNTPDQLDDVAAFVDEHGEMQTAEQSAAPTWRLLVAPIKGHFKQATETPDELSSGAVIGSVANLRDEVPITAPHGGKVLEWLVSDGDPVSPGQPLVRLHPLPEADSLAVTP